MSIEDSIKRLREALPFAFAVTLNGALVEGNVRASWNAADALMQHLDEIAPGTPRAIQPLYAIERTVLAHLLAALDEREAQPVAWSITFMGEHGGNFFGLESRAQDELRRLNRLYPSQADKREIVPLYAARKELT